MWAPILRVEPSMGPQFRPAPPVSIELVSVERLCGACVFMMTLIPIDLWLLDQVQVFVSVMIGASAVVGVLIDPHT